MYVNARVLSVPSNGQRRVAEEIIQRLPESKLVSPGASIASGIGGHLWEQCVLPWLTHDKPLWSPSTSGPVYHSNHIVTVHDIAFVDGREWFSRSYGTLYDNLVCRLAKRARHIITVSEFTRGRLIEHYRVPEDRVTAIHSGSSPAFYPRSVEQVAECRERLGIQCDGYLVAFLGYDPRKNYQRVIDAWSRIEQKYPSKCLVTFGRMSNAKVFRASDVEDHIESVRHLGSISDDELACVFSGAAGFVFPSLYEGFGLPVIEASACGCPIVTSNTTALPEVSPADALLVDPLSVTEISTAMGNLLDEAVPLSGEDEAASVRRRFDWNQTAKSYQLLFDKHFN